MGIFEYMNERVKKMNIFDVKLAQGCAIFLALIIVKILPQIMSINVWWFVCLLVLCATRPLYAFYIKK
ncbi:MAG: hypothetical protein ACFFCW_30640 [Candidatus Hodarchaeota archaeon]|nr:MAG: hypothetical protein JSV97_10605 [candidate division WOR-3 bacterium]